MSNSRNVRSKYQVVPAHVLRSIAVRDSGDNARTRDSRSRDKQAFRATLTSIRSRGV